MALLSGTAEFTAGEYVSHVLPRVARLLETVHGGQVVLGEATRGLLLGQLPDGVSLRDLGEYRLRGLAEPEHVFQLAAPALRAEYPPSNRPPFAAWRSVLEASRQLGRERDLAEVVSAAPARRCGC